MTTILGRDAGAITLARFGGRLFRATLHHETSGSADTSDPTSIAVTDVDYVCDALAFGYKVEAIDGSRVHKADYRVTIVRSSIASVLDDGVHASLDIAEQSAHFDTVVEAVVEGASGNEITVELVAPSLSFPITPVLDALTEHGTNVRIGYLPGVTTVADIELLLATATLIRVKTPGTGANVLDADDTFGATPLAGGVNASVEQANIVPTAGDTIECPPPGQTVAQLGRIVEIEMLSEAQITCHVRGGETF